MNALLEMALSNLLVAALLRGARGGLRSLAAAACSDA